MKRVDVPPDVLKSFCGIGLDLGRYAAKLHLQVGDRVYREEIPSRGRPDEEVLKAVVSEVVEVSRAWGPVETAALASDLKAAESEYLMARLTEALPAIRLEAVDPLDARAAPWYALPDEDAGPLWILDVGWLETGLHQVVAEGGEPRVSSSRSEKRFHGRLIDLGILTTLREFGHAFDIERVFDDMDAQEYKLAEDLKRQLSTKQVVRPPKGGVSMRASTFQQDLFNETDWRGYPDFLVNEFVRDAMRQDGGSLVFSGASCRLPWLVAKLLDGLPGLTPLEIPGGDPAYVRAMGLACYALRSVLASWEPPVEVPVEVPAEVPAAELVEMPVTKAAEIESAAEPESTGVRPALTADVHGLHVRLAGTMVPMFQAPIHCAALPSFLKRDGKAEIELQCFDSVAGDGMSSPRFVGRLAIAVPADRAYVLRMELLRPHPLEVQVVVSTGDGQIFKEYAWDVMEEG